MLQEAKTQIKVEIKNIIIGKQTYAQGRTRVQKIVKEAVKELESEQLKKIAMASLEAFANTTMANSLVAMGIPTTAVILAIGFLRNGRQVQDVLKTYQKMAKMPPKTDLKGKLEQQGKVLLIEQPNQEYGKTYKEAVKRALDEILKAEPMYDTNVSLRNVAEMTVRYEKTLKNIDELKQKGVNLIQTSRHANCSKRCEKWQGGYYTLDDTYQVVDGIQFQPLSNATDIYYTTKKGKVYKNGHLTGYNCRHYAVEYRKGHELPMVSARVVQRERMIDAKMRAYERRIRAFKERSLLDKGVDEKASLIAKVKWKRLYEEYKHFAEANKRAFYPDRTEVF